MLSVAGEPFEPLDPGPPPEGPPGPLGWWPAALVLAPFAALIALGLSIALASITRSARPSRTAPSARPGSEIIQPAAVGTPTSRRMRPATGVMNHGPRGPSRCPG